MFGFWKKKAQESRNIGYTCYQAIVNQVRKEWFYKELNINDTPFGRFEIMSIHLFLLLRRLKQEKTPLARDISQRISDFFVVDLAESLRELNLGEGKIATQFNKFIQGFYGRLIAYDKAFEENESALKRVIHRNLYENKEEAIPKVDVVASYIQYQSNFLQKQELENLHFKDILE